MNMEKRIEIMASTYDISVIVAFLRAQANLTPKKEDLIREVVSSWQTWIAVKLELSPKDVVDAYKSCEIFDENHLKMSFEAIKKDAN